MAYNQQQPNVAWYDSGATSTSGASAYGSSDARQRSTAATAPTFAPPAPAFIPPPASFDSFDAAAGPSSAFGYGGGGGYTGADRGTTGPGGGFEDEPPLLEELGIDLSGIVRRSVAVLTGRASAAVGGAAGVSSSSSSAGGNNDDGPDLGGPLLFAAALGATHLLASKLHFGVILGWTVVGSFASWVVAGNLAAAAAADAAASANTDPASSSSASSPPHASAGGGGPLPPFARVA